MTTDEANKYVSNYESMTQKIMGFMNCISRALTGEDVMEAPNTDLNKLVFSGKRTEKVSLSECFSRQGVKLNRGLASTYSSGTPEQLELPKSLGGNKNQK